MASEASFIPMSYGLRLYAGDGAGLQVTVTNPGGDPMPLSGEVLAQIKRFATDLDVMAQFTVTLEENIATLTLTGAQTAELGDFAGVWDCQWAAPEEEPRTLLRGPVQCQLDVSRG